MKKETTVDKSHKKWVVGVVITLFLVAVLLAVVFHYRLFFAVMAGYGVGVDIVPVMSFYYDFLQVVGSVIVAVVGAVATIVPAIGYYNRVKTDRDRFEHQAEIETKQFNQAENRLYSEQLIKATELMEKEVAGKPAIVARVSGINIMDEVANAAPGAFSPQIVKTMVAYIKDNAQITAKPTKEKGEPLPDEARILGEDVKAAFTVIDGLFAKRESGGISGTLSPDILDFSNADFSHLNLNKQQVPEVRWFKKWREADLSGADLHQAELKHADFTGAIMHGADLSRAELGGANLCYAQLQGASLFHAYLQDPPPVLHDPDFPSSKADFYWANMSYAHVDFKRWQARFHATDFSNAVIKKGPFSYDDVGGKIWHSEQKEFTNVRQQGTDDWSFVLSVGVSTSALVGVFRNFAKRGDDQGDHFRKEVLRLEKLPPDLPRKWRRWLDLNRHLRALGKYRQTTSENKSAQ